jgi:hypothetical protein
MNVNDIIPPRWTEEQIKTGVAIFLAALLFGLAALLFWATWRRDHVYWLDKKASATLHHRS